MADNFSRKDMKEFADYCRNGLTNIEFSHLKLEHHLRDWELIQSKKQGRMIEDGFGGIWSARCPTCKNETMQIVRPGKVQCSKCS
jgi:hypothetical protein